MDITRIPVDFPVQPVLVSDSINIMQCGTCLLCWDDSIATSMTPVPSGRCPFEMFHDEADDFDSGEQCPVCGELGYNNPDDCSVCQSEDLRPLSAALVIFEKHQNGNHSECDVDGCYHATTLRTQDAFRNAISTPIEPNYLALAIDCPSNLSDTVIDLINKTLGSLVETGILIDTEWTWVETPS